MRRPRSFTPQVDGLEQRLVLSTGHAPFHLPIQTGIHQLAAHVNKAATLHKALAPSPRPVHVVHPSIHKAPIRPAHPIVPVAAVYRVNAFVNLGTGPYPEASLITNGNAQPWFNSSQITKLFGGSPPTISQQAAFNSTVMQRIGQTFANSGISLSLTDNPAVPAAHTLSLVSNTLALRLPTAIGMTNLGANGFSFIDQEAAASQTLDQLEWIVAHNISHELMLSFGVGENYDQTGNFIDSTNANWLMMVSSTSSFSPSAAAAIRQALASA